MHIVLCGSMSVARKIVDVETELLSMGHTVTVPDNLEAHACSHRIEDGREKESLDVFKAYFKKIRDADAILVVNEMKNGAENYIGPNSLIEMAFAHILDKRIYLLYGIPAGYGRDEIAAMHPVELHTNLSAIHS